MNLDTKLIKKSKARFVDLGGRQLEFYEYEKPYFYNFPPLKRGNEDGGVSTQRRKDNLFYARQKITRLVTCNTNYKESAPRFVTFTFARNVTSLREANDAWGVFIRKFRAEFGNRKYLAVIEFQKRGAVHYHVLFFDLKFRKGIKQIFRNLWGNGFIKFKSAKKIQGIDELGLYLAKYLQKDILDNRLLGEKAFFTSRNLTRPIVYRREDTVDFFRDFYKDYDMIEQKYRTSHFGIVKKTIIKICE